MVSPNYQVSELYIYPIKSMAGIQLQHSELCETGLLFDRRWMLIDEHHHFLSQRELPELCLFQLSQTETGFEVKYKQSSIDIPKMLNAGKSKRVMIWDDTVDALEANSTINNWFSEQLNKHVSLVYMPTTTKRLVDVSQNNIVSFADGYPLLIIGTEALRLVTFNTAETIPVNRFRPNIVFTGGQAHDEDAWSNFTIQHNLFECVKPCYRCTVININQNNGQMNAEPLKTLATYRKQNQKIAFGQNCIGPLKGLLTIGDSINIISFKK